MVSFLGVAFFPNGARLQRLPLNKPALFWSTKKVVHQGHLYKINTLNMRLLMKGWLGHCCGYHFRAVAQQRRKLAAVFNWSAHPNGTHAARHTGLMAVLCKITQFA